MILVCELCYTTNELTRTYIFVLFEHAYCWKESRCNGKINPLLIQLSTEDSIRSIELHNNMVKIPVTAIHTQTWSPVTPTSPRGYQMNCVKSTLYLNLPKYNYLWQTFFHYWIEGKCKCFVVCCLLKIVYVLKYTDISKLILVLTLTIWGYHKICVFNHMM